MYEARTLDHHCAGVEADTVDLHDLFFPVLELDKAFVWAEIIDSIHRQSLSPADMYANACCVIDTIVVF